MRIAALILAYHRPDLLKHLIERLRGDLWQTYVHLDKKSVAANFAQLARKTYSFEQIYNTNWGSHSCVIATLHLMRNALEDPANTHFYLMSGQCFPVKTDEQISALLNSEAGNFISLFEMPVSHKPLSRLTGWHFHDAKAVGVDSDLLRRIAQKVSRRLPQRRVAKILRGMRPYGGSTWWMINRESASAALMFIEKNGWYLDAFRWSYIPEEMFLHTIIANLGIRPDRGSPTFAKWIDGDSHPLLMNHALLLEAKASWQLMARKFDAVID